MSAATRWGARLSHHADIADYAVIGDGSSVALVSRGGSIDWLCWPRFDSPSLFAALLDHERGGCFVVRPRGEAEVQRGYVDETNVLRTVFTTATGRLELLDLMPVARDAETDPWLYDSHEVLRLVTCLDGEMDVEVTLDLRPDYARRAPRHEDRGALGHFFLAGAQAFILRSDFDLRADEAGRLTGTARLSAGERRTAVLAYEIGEPAVLPLIGEHAERKLERTLDYWREWSQRCRYDGPYRAAVVRSALAVKLLAYSRSGAIVAAATTSLPEDPGGTRNWDYRYCWLRDTSMTLRSLFDLGYDEEGTAFFHWLTHALGGRQPDLRILYDVYGKEVADETTFDHLRGYHDSRPVRVGNDAGAQFQLDMYGEVVSALWEHVQRVGRLGAGEEAILQQLGDVLLERWDEPDEGIWEVRSGQVSHTYSVAMVWVGLQRLLDLHEHHGLDVPAERCAKVAEQAREAVETGGWNEALGTYTSTFGGDEVDASLLLLSVYGFCDADAPRMQATRRCVVERLACDGLLYRYPPDIDDGLPGNEGMFGICSAWHAEVLAAEDRLDEARQALDALLDRANDVGLLSEEFGADGAMLGNFPQAFTHVGVISAALRIAEAAGRS